MYYTMVLNEDKTKWIVLVRNLQLAFALPDYEDMKASNPKKEYRLIEQSNYDFYKDKNLIE